MAATLILIGDAPSIRGADRLGRWALQRVDSVDQAPVERPAAVLLAVSDLGPESVEEVAARWPDTPIIALPNPSPRALTRGRWAPPR